MKKFKVDYSEKSSRARKSSVVSAVSSEDLYDKLMKKYPGIKVHRVTEIEGGQAAPVAEAQGDAPAVPPVQAPVSSHTENWQAAVELYPYSSSSLVRIFIFLFKMLCLLLGIRSVGVLSEREGELIVQTKSYVLWFITAEEEVSYIKRKSISAATRTVKKNLYSTHYFVTIQYSGSAGGQRWWLKGVSLSEIDSAVERWIATGASGSN